MLPLGGCGGLFGGFGGDPYEGCGEEGEGEAEDVEKDIDKAVDEGRIFNVADGGPRSV